MRIMYDAVTPSRIPKDAQMVAGYVNGHYKWTDADWSMFPHAAHVHIDVLGDSPHAAGVLDVERGAATVAETPGWIRARRAYGHQAVIYCSRSLSGEIVRACKGLTYKLWIADWTCKPHQVPGSIATQYQNTPGYDLSAVYDDRWHPGPKAKCHGS